MELKKMVPWNWFKKEDEHEGQSALPVRRSGGNQTMSPFFQFHQEIDRMFEDFFRGFGFPAPGQRVFPSLGQSEWLKPTVDIAANGKEYTISVEIPGVEEKDLSLDLSEGTLRIRGEKRQEKEDKEVNFYRMERSFGSFQRVISLPEDIDEEGISARYANGVLTVKLPRASKPGTEARKIAIKASNGSAQEQITG